MNSVRPTAPQTPLYIGCENAGNRHSLALIPAEQGVRMSVFHGAMG